MPEPQPNRCPTCRRRYKRSTESNARYWLLLHKIAEKVKPEGQIYSAETWHQYFKSRLLGCDEVTMPNRKVLVIPKSSADLAIDEFSNFMQAVETWAAEREVWLDE